MSSWLGLIELGIVLVFVLGWGVLELVGLRMDQRRFEEADRAAAESAGTGTPRHAEGEQALHPGRSEPVER